MITVDEKTFDVFLQKNSIPHTKMVDGDITRWYDENKREIAMLVDERKKDIANVGYITDKNGKVIVSIVKEGTPKRFIIAGMLAFKFMQSAGVPSEKIVVRA